MRNYPRNFQRTPKPRPAGLTPMANTTRLAADSSSEPHREMYRGGTQRTFVPRNRRAWKDAVRHVYFQLAGILRRPMREVRAVGLVGELSVMVRKAPKDAGKGGRLVRRLTRLRCCEPKPQVAR